MCYFEPVNCATFEEYLQKLSLTNSDWWDDHQCHWIFRGQNTESNLLPSIYRESENFSYKKIFDFLSDKIFSPDRSIKSFIENSIYEVKDLEPENSMRLYEIITSAFVESHLIQEFIKRSNQIRQPIPSIKIFEQRYEDVVGFFQDYIHKEIPKFIKKFRSHNEYSGFFPSFLEFGFPENVALARHHGIPNRYLDWTKDPLIAAFFSAHKINNDNGKIYVWALNKKYLSINCRGGYLRFRDELIHHGLEFLHIQKGLFTEMIGGEGYYYKEGKWPSLDEYLSKTYINGEGTPYGNYIKRISLPRKEAGKLLERLDRMGVNMYQLMPSYDTVAKSILEKKI